jgi:hypothetical protein
MQTCNELEASIQHSVSLNEKLLQQVLREALRAGGIKQDYNQQRILYEPAMGL